LLVCIIYATNAKVYTIWYCGDDGCGFGKEPTLENAQWIINRGDGRPTANVVVLSFVDPLALAKGTTDGNNINGIPRGMTKKVVNFFSSRNITVMLSIGGEVYSSNGR